MTYSNFQRCLLLARFGMSIEEPGHCHYDSFHDRTVLSN